MKRTVLVFGLIAGVILSVMMLITLPFHEEIGFDRALIVGYTTIVLAFLLIFFGVRSYRDNVGGGRVSFGRALAVGALIGVVASACYVATWEVVYFNFMPDYLEKYQAHMVEKARAAGETEASIALQTAEMAKWAEWYKNPAINVAMTLMEPLPVALAIALVSAAVLSGLARAVLDAIARSVRGVNGRARDDDRVAADRHPSR